MEDFHKKFPDTSGLKPLYLAIWSTNQKIIKDIIKDEGSGYIIAVDDFPPCPPCEDKTAKITYINDKKQYFGKLKFSKEGPKAQELFLPVYT